jgi:hypothetical protein
MQRESDQKAKATAKGMEAPVVSLRRNAECVCCVGEKQSFSELGRVRVSHARAAAVCSPVSENPESDVYSKFPGVEAPRRVIAPRCFPVSVCTECAKDVLQSGVFARRTGLVVPCGRFFPAGEKKRDGCPCLEEPLPADKGTAYPQSERKPRTTPWFRVGFCEGETHDPIFFGLECDETRRAEYTCLGMQVENLLRRGVSLGRKNIDRCPIAHK